MTPADVEPAAAAMLLGDFGDRERQLAFATSHPECRPFVADAGGAIVGTGMATINGTVAWIGIVWVDASFRRRGLGRALTQAAIDAAEAAGCRTLLLVATSAGRPLYERMGFSVQTTYRILEAPGLGPDGGPPDARVRAFETGDLQAMLKLDGSATGEDRGHLLAAFATPESGRCLVDAAGAVRGFIVRTPWGGGATIAPDPDDAIAILRARRLAQPAGGRVRAGLLDENTEGLSMLASAGWTEAWHAPRLIRGEPFDWDPAAIWGQINFAKG